MNIVIKAMILTLHARACLSIFTHLIGFVLTCTGRTLGSV